MALSEALQEQMRRRTAAKGVNDIKARRKALWDKPLAVTEPKNKKNTKKKTKNAD